jgi:hypothetical protein
MPADNGDLGMKTNHSYRRSSQTYKTTGTVRMT